MYQILQEIQEHRKNGYAISRADGFATSRNGRKVPKMTTRGWELFVGGRTAGLSGYL